MPCGCQGGARNGITSRSGATFPVQLPDGSVRNYLTEAEQQAAIRALARQAAREQQQLTST